MSKSKKYFLFLFTVLLMLSILHDLSKDTITPNPNEQMIQTDIEMMTIKVMPGDTVLSITEEINDFKSLNLNRIIEDFQHLNPGSNYQSLNIHQYYYFPLYNE